MKLIAWWQNLERKQQTAALLLSVYAVVFPLAQLGRQQAAGVVFYPSDIVVLLWLVIHHSSAWQFAKVVFNWMKQHPLSWFVAAWAIGTLCVGSIVSEQLRPVLITLRIAAYFTFAGSVGVVFIKKSLVIRWLLVITGGIIAMLGLLQYAFLPDTRFLQTLGWDDHYYRLLGTFLDPNFAGMALVLTLLATISLHRHMPKSWLISLLILLVVCIALTFSRSSYLALAVALGCTLCLRQVLSGWRWQEKSVLGGILVVSFAATLLLAPKPGGEGVKLLRTSSVRARATATQEYVTELQPWTIVLGSGLFVRPEEVQQDVAPFTPQPEATPPLSVFFTAQPDGELPNHAQVPDNILITLISGIGIIGTVGTVALGLIFLYELGRRETIAAVALISTIVHSQFNNTLFEPFIFQYLMLFILIPIPVTLSLEHRFRAKTKISKKKIA